MRMRQKMFLILFVMVNSNIVEFTQHGGEKFEKNVYFFVHAAAATSTARNS